MIKKPILSDQEKKRTLSAKKKQKVVLKNLLVQPFERFWPELTAEDVQEFVETFRTLYTSISCNGSNSFTNGDQVRNHTSDNFSGKVTLGLRSSIRCVSTGNRIALFISSNIRPKYVVDQIITMTLTKNAKSKVFCVPDLDAALSKVLGFSCQCLVIPDRQNEMWNWISEKSKQFPLPNCFEERHAIKAKGMDVKYNQTTSVCANESEAVDVSKIYLRKENSNERVFVPSGTTLTKSGNDFIALGDFNLKFDPIRSKNQMISKTQTAEQRSDSKREKKFLMNKKKPKESNQQFHIKKVNYLPLKVNRVQPNL
ncbi:hypothetical protein Bhyg_00557, partial [Pseudolycoriella hygida]